MLLDQVRSQLPLYHYDRLFADYWIGAIAVGRERCLAEVRAAKAPPFVYDYNLLGGWAKVGSDGKPEQARVVPPEDSRPAGGGKPLGSRPLISVPQAAQHRRDARPATRSSSLAIRTAMATGAVGAPRHIFTPG